MVERTVILPRWVYLGAGEVRTGAAVVVEGDRIVQILPAEQAEGIDGRRIELADKVLLPGLINMHTHAGAGPVGRAISEDYELPTGMPFYVPLSRLWRHAYREELREQFRAVIEWDVLGMMRTGTTTILNHASTDIEGYLHIAERVGVRTFAGPTIPLDVTHRLGQLSGGLEDRKQTTSEQAQLAELEELERLFGEWDGAADGRITMILGPAAVHTDEFSVLAGVGAAAQRLDCLVTTHLCQAPSELATTQERFGTTPLRVLQRAELANERLIAAHGTYLPDEDRQLAADTGITIVHCASRKAKEAVISPSVSFMDSGISVALGTDGFNCDMVEELKFTAMLGKIGVAQSHRPTAAQVVDLATSHAASVLRRPDLGVIKEGARADLIGVAITDPSIAPALDVVQSLVYYGNGRDVQFEMVDGAVVMEDGTFVGVDINGVRARAEAALTSIWESAIDAGVVNEVLPSINRSQALA
ncbi:amidohydrolase family protein [Micromonospora profundi]|uniref:amidohydrolase family protein n=1 Tax=Micromonospora TaxID=1873 RepID=UPI0006AF9200|nr:MULTISPECIES: amidohydrolase family protein [Micromonospora]NJC10748.1 cytosine/adenosine deaminase-related metal-dependent hydrolase [Micromonospora profundi]